MSITMKGNKWGADWDPRVRFPQPLYLATNRFICGGQYF